MRQLTGAACLLWARPGSQVSSGGIGLWSGRCAEVSWPDFVLWDPCLFAYESRSRGLRELPAVTFGGRCELAGAYRFPLRVESNCTWWLGVGELWKSVMFDADQTCGTHFVLDKPSELTCASSRPGTTREKSCGAFGKLKDRVVPGC